MLQPAKTKYRKWHRRRNRQYGVATTGTLLSFGTYGLKAMSGGEINSRQIEAARKAVAHSLKRGGKIWIRIFPHQPITRKAAEVPMGAGKGNVEFYIAQIKTGQVLLEMEGVEEAHAREAMYLAGSKLPVRTRFVMSKR
ncbi:50S ribosomal protein L16 [Candidatus Peregrinibacteria bacterium]|nr:50S ribosomal protein L16 [Candidatus Peregrinibacteria bacterium]